MLAAAQNRARDLANTPANDLTPTALADYAAAAADALEGLAVDVLERERDPRGRAWARLPPWPRAPPRRRG